MNFAEALNVKVDDIEKPPLLPAGVYRAVVKKIPSIEERGQEWEALDFPMQIVEAVEGVDDGDLATYGGLGPQSMLRHSFMLSKTDETGFKQTMYNIKRFALETLKVDASAGASMKEILDNTPGKECLVFVKHIPDKRDPAVIHANISKTAPIV